MIERHHYKTTTTPFQKWRARDNRNIKKIRRDIASKVNGKFLPTALSKTTRVNIIHLLNHQPKDFIRKLDYLDQRHWISEICCFQYKSSNERCYTYNKLELQKIDYKLEKEGIDKKAEVEFNNPKRCKRMRIDK